MQESPREDPSRWDRSERQRLLEELEAAHQEAKESQCALQQSVQVGQLLLQRNQELESQIEQLMSPSALDQRKMSTVAWNSAVTPENSLLESSASEVDHTNTQVGHTRSSVLQDHMQELEEKNRDLDEECARLEGQVQRLRAELDSENSLRRPKKTNSLGEGYDNFKVDKETQMSPRTSAQDEKTWTVPSVQSRARTSSGADSVLQDSTSGALSMESRHGSKPQETRSTVLPPKRTEGLWCKRVDELELEVEDLKEQNEQASGEVSRLQGVRDVLEAQCAELQDSLSGTEQLLDEEQNRSDLLRKQVEQLQSLIDEEADKWGRVLSRCEEARASLSQETDDSSIEKQDSRRTIEALGDCDPAKAGRGRASCGREECERCKQIEEIAAGLQVALELERKLVETLQEEVRHLNKQVLDQGPRRMRSPIRGPHAPPRLSRCARSDQPGARGQCPPSPELLILSLESFLEEVPKTVLPCQADAKDTVSLAAPHLPAPLPRPTPPSSAPSSPISTSFWRSPKRC